MSMFTKLAGLTLVAASLITITGCGDAGSSNANTSASNNANASAKSSPAKVLTQNVTKAVDKQTQAVMKEAGQLPKALPVLDLAGIQKLAKETAEQDRVLVIDFWATWCPPCVAQFPAMHEGLVKLGKDKVRPVTITLDAPGKLETKAIEFLAKHHALEDAYRAPEDTDAQIAIVDGIGDKWDQIVVPAVFVFNHDGEIVGQYFNGPPEVPDMLKQVKELTEK